MAKVRLNTVEDEEASLFAFYLLHTDEELERVYIGLNGNIKDIARHFNYDEKIVRYRADSLLLKLLKRK